MCIQGSSLQRIENQDLRFLQKFCTTVLIEQIQAIKRLTDRDVDRHTLLGRNKYEWESETMPKSEWKMMMNQNISVRLFEKSEKAETNELWFRSIKCKIELNLNSTSKLQFNAITKFQLLPMWYCTTYNINNTKCSYDTEVHKGY